MPHHPSFQLVEEVPEEAGRDRVSLAVQKDDGALEYVPYALKTPELCLAAVRQDGGALEYVPYALKTPELCLAVVQQDGWSLEYVPYALKTPELCLNAVQRNTWALIPNCFSSGARKASRKSPGNSNVPNRPPCVCWTGLKPQNTASCCVRGGAEKAATSFHAPQRRPESA
jgi:hypothetical protein